MADLKVTILSASFEAFHRIATYVTMTAHVEVRGKRYDVVLWSRPGAAHRPRSWSIQGAFTQRNLRYGPTLHTIVDACQARIDGWIGGPEYEAQRLKSEGKRLSELYTLAEHREHWAKRNLAEVRREFTKARRNLKAFQQKHPGVLP
jgi:hypothetical protein